MGHDPRVEEFDALVVGAGFAGMYMLHNLRERGFTCHAFEAGLDVGGTWYWNRYPGARCDVESLDYCYSFSRKLYEEWDWTERYATQPEILSYAKFVAEKLHLGPDISFGSTVTGAVFDDAASQWQVDVDTHGTVRCRFLILAVGCLSSAQVPELPGLDSFAGRVLHTGRWPHETVDVTGCRVAVIGTGSSGIQLIPELARSATRLTVFQRTPNFSFPARNRLLTRRDVWQSKLTYGGIVEQAKTSGAGHFIGGSGRSAREVDDAERQSTFERAWQVGGTEMLSAYSDILHDPQSNEYLAHFVREKIHSLVVDPRTAAALAPDHPIGAKRPCVDTQYFETYNRDNVDLVDLHEESIEEVTASGIRTSLRHHEFDLIAFATGYDAMTGPLTRIHLTDTHGTPLAIRWSDGPAAYLGLAISGFPNMFTITGPGSPSVLVNVIRAIEQHVEWIIDLLTHMRAHGLERVEADASMEADWARNVDALSYRTLHRLANSWYLGSNVPGKPRVFMPFLGGLAAYRSKCDEVAATGYAGFSFRATMPTSP